MHHLLDTAVSGKGDSPNISLHYIRPLPNALLMMTKNNISNDQVSLYIEPLIAHETISREPVAMCNGASLAEHIPVARCSLSELGVRSAFQTKTLAMPIEKLGKD